LLIVAYLLRLVHCLATTNQPDTPLFFNYSNTRFSYNSLKRVARLKTNIRDVKYALYQKAERLWWCSLAGWLFAVVVAIVAIFTDDTNVLAIIGGVSLLLPFCIIWLREIASGYSYKADKCRRMLLYSDGLGEEPSKTEMLSVSGYILRDDVKEAYYEPPYYASRLEPGPSRLLDIIGESSFFTKELSKKTAKYLTWILVVFFVAFLLLGFSSRFWVGFVDTTREGFVDFIEAFTLFILSLVAGDVWLLKTKYEGLMSAADRVFSSAFKLKDNEKLTEHDVISLASDYDACVQACPPIPTIIYKRYLRALNTLYKKVVE